MRSPGLSSSFSSPRHKARDAVRLYGLALRIGSAAAAAMALANGGAAAHHLLMALTLAGARSPAETARTPAVPPPGAPRLALTGAVALSTPWAEAMASEGFSALAPATAARPARGLDAVATGIGTQDDAAALLLCIDGPVAWALAEVRRLRDEHAQRPLLVIARQARVLDQVLLLELGADDVLAADTPAAVVAAKLRRLVARATAPTHHAANDAAAGATTPAELHCGGLSLRQAERSAWCCGQRLALTEGEFEVLWLLALQPGQAVSRTHLLRRVRGLAWERLDRAIDSRIYRLRRKLAGAGPGLPEVRTLRHQGYALVLAN
jgi:two-component system, OmpR family, response regulator RstA